MGVMALKSHAENKFYQKLVKDRIKIASFFDKKVKTKKDIKQSINIIWKRWRKKNDEVEASCSYRMEEVSVVDETSI